MTEAQNESAIRFPRQFGQIRQMVEAQAGLNAQAYSQTWMTMGGKREEDPEVWDYPLAAAMEIAEFLNSWTYAWWATKTWPITKPADLQNCMTELVDAWHFILSQALIEENGDIYEATMSLAHGFKLTNDAGVQGGHRQVIIHAKKLMSYLADYAETTAPQVLIYAKFFELLSAAGFSMDHFTARYNAKLQLNIFRQLNGYKEKPRTYQKEWAEGLEDNYFLAEYIDKAHAALLAGEINSMPTDTEVMRWIAASYAKHTGVKTVNTPSTEEEAE